MMGKVCPVSHPYGFSRKNDSGRTDAKGRTDFQTKWKR